MVDPDHGMKNRVTGFMILRLASIVTALFRVQMRCIVKLIRKSLAMHDSRPI